MGADHRLHFVSDMKVTPELLRGADHVKHDIWQAAAPRDAVRASVVAEKLFIATTCPSCGSQLRPGPDIGCGDSWHEPADFITVRVIGSAVRRPQGVDLYGEACPECGAPLEYDEVDIGVGTLRRPAGLSGMPLDAEAVGGAEERRRATVSEERKTREGDQPLPLPVDGPAMQDLVIADIESRKALGLKRYGQLLKANDGRDALQDAYEEAQDLCIYLRKCIYERDGK